MKAGPANGLHHVFLGIDLGTSELKLLLLDESHRILAIAREPLTVQRPRPLWSEQDPADWWRALDAAMARLASEQPAALARLRAIGLAGQMHGAVAIDARGEVLRPAILWNDGRSFAQCEALARAVPGLERITGNLAMPGFTAPKLLWMREHEPELFARVDGVLLPKDWLRFALCGERIGEMSDASGTLWLDVGRRDWSDELLAACGLGRAEMPRLVEGSEPAGRLDAALAARWGLPAGVTLAGGGGDNAASAVGMGLVQAGEGFVSLGTSGVVFVCGDRFAPNSQAAVHAFCHALPGRWHQMSVMLAAASALGWAVRAFGFRDEAELLGQAALLAPEARRTAPLFLPYLSGERSPHNDAQAQGVLFGVTQRHGRAEVAHAVAEGVCMGLRDGLETLAPPAGELMLVGGGARSVWWSQLLADVLQVPLALAEGGESAGALGAARLAWLSVGGAMHEVCRRPATRRLFTPDAGAAGELTARHARFRAIYPAVRPLFVDAA